MNLIKELLCRVHTAATRLQQAHGGLPTFLSAWTLTVTRSFVYFVCSKIPQCIGDMCNPLNSFMGFELHFCLSPFTTIQFREQNRLLGFPDPDVLLREGDGYIEQIRTSIFSSRAVLCEILILQCTCSF